jgi:nicotinamide riboside kinase
VDQEGKTALAKKLAENYNLSLLDYSRAFKEDKASSDKKNGQEDT